MESSIITLVIAILAAFGAKFVPSPLSWIIMILAGLVIVFVLLSLL